MQLYLYRWHVPFVLYLIDDRKSMTKSNQIGKFKWKSAFVLFITKAA